MASKEQRRVNAIEAARGRRFDRSAAATVRTEWFIDRVSSQVKMSAKSRVRVATEFLKNAVIVNISRPVTKTVVGGRTVVTNRSKPGEFPKADTTQLMKTIFSVYESRGGVHDGFVGTPLDYGLILELYMDRSFLLRTFTEENDRIMRILSGPIT